MPTSTRYIYANLLTLAKLEGVSKWKDAKQPSIKGWYNRIWDCFILARITDKIMRETIPGHKSHLGDNWSAVVDHLTKHDIVPPKVLYELVYTL